MLAHQVNLVNMTGALRAGIVGIKGTKHTVEIAHAANQFRGSTRKHEEKGREAHDDQQHDYTADNQANLDADRHAVFTRAGPLPARRSSSSSYSSRGRDRRGRLSCSASSPARLAVLFGDRDSLGKNSCSSRRPLAHAVLPYEVRGPQKAALGQASQFVGRHRAPLPSIRGVIPVSHRKARRRESLKKSSKRPLF